MPPPAGPIEPRRRVVPEDIGRAGFARAFWPLFRSVVASFEPSASSATVDQAVSALMAHSGGGEVAWGRGLWNWNFGNIHAYHGERRWSGVDHLVSTGEAYGTFFRAYTSAAEGCADYCGFMKFRARGAWEEILEGDPDLIFVRLRQWGYFGSDAPESGDAATIPIVRDNRRAVLAAAGDAGLLASPTKSTIAGAVYGGGLALAALAAVNTRVRVL